MPPERTESPQGHELSMAVHVLGPVLMTELLHERLRDGRVILVSSGGMYAQRLPAADPEFREGDYAPATAYARSKRMRSEEHTSELQSLMRISYAVFCLKNKNIHTLRTQN